MTDAEKMRELELRFERLTAQLTAQIENLVNTVNRLEHTIQETCVTKQEFNPVKQVAYGTLSIICGSVLTALVASVLTKGLLK